MSRTSDRLHPEDPHADAADVRCVDVMKDAHEQGRTDAVIEGEQGPAEALSSRMNLFDK